MEVKLQRKINAADTIRTWSIVRGDIVFYCCLPFFSRSRSFMEMIWGNKEKSYVLTEN